MITSTYRLQINPAFPLDAAVSVVDYLTRLGVDAVYTSPLLTASPGSTHGYDVVDPTKASPELGGEEARQRLVAAVKSAGLSLVVDIVPNHMSVEVPAANPWWWDVLKNGRESAYATYFDIDWSRGPVLLPILGSDSLEDLKVEEDHLKYFEHEFPLAPGTGQGTPQEVHDRQNYRLVNWRRGNAELTYRRFFDITTLAAVRVEDPEVFEATHGEVLRWVHAGEVAGLRVDHPDGLADPGAYMRRLRAEAPEAWLVVEKILAADEPLPASWPVDGTTGYDALREICGLFIDPQGEAALTTLAADLGRKAAAISTAEQTSAAADRGLRPPEIQRTGEHRQDLAAGAQPVDNSAAAPSPVDNPPAMSPPSGSVEPGGRRPTLHDVETECRRLVTRTALVAEMRRIATLANVAPEAVAEIMVAFPVYRSYLPEGLDHWAAAISTATRANPDLAADIGLIDDAVRMDPRGELATRIQQTSGMVVAKGVEDTAFYRWTRFVALNEVGGAPDRFGVTPAEFHTLATARAAGSPRSMTTLSTHDTKRSEDVRARLAVLAEIPGEWAETVGKWSRTHGISEPTLDNLAWQSLVGAWPISADRLRAYLDKAAKEAKIRTSWVDHDEAFEAEIAAWPGKVINDLGADIDAFVRRIAGPGWSNALGQKIVQLAGPGIPDVYQGTDLFDLSLVDPDNRRPVDFVMRQEILSRLEDGWFPDVDDTGAAKLHVVRQVLRLRRDRPDLFTGYRPLQSQGPATEHVLAFSRAPELVVVATRLPVRLARNGWGDTVLPLPGGPGNWHNLLTGNPVETGPEPRTAVLADLLSHYPVALLLRGNR